MTPVISLQIDVDTLMDHKRGNYFTILNLLFSSSGCSIYVAYPTFATKASVCKIQENMVSVQLDRSFTFTYL